MTWTSVCQKASLMQAEMVKSQRCDPHHPCDLLQWSVPSPNLSSTLVNGLHNFFYCLFKCSWIINVRFDVPWKTDENLKAWIINSFLVNVPLCPRLEVCLAFMLFQILQNTFPYYLTQM
jgi:hypothetical protein